VNPNDPYAMMDLAWIRAMLDKHGEARELMDKALEMAPDDPYTHFYDGMVSLRAGDETATIAALEAAVEKGYSRILLGAEPHLASLRNNSRFSALISGG
jgi:predicted TPR repeat methyltransferase